LTVTEAGVGLANRANVAVEACDAMFFAALGRHAAPFRARLRALR
jgi:hypothetical protein